MTWPRFRIGTLMKIVAVAGLVLAAIPAIRDQVGFAMFCLGASCWPILTTTVLLWGLENSWRRRGAGRKAPGVGVWRPRRQRLFFGSAAGVIATGIIVHATGNSRLMHDFVVVGFGSLISATLAAPTILIGRLFSFQDLPPR